MRLKHTSLAYYLKLRQAETRACLHKFRVTEPDSEKSINRKQRKVFFFTLSLIVHDRSKASVFLLPLASEVYFFVNQKENISGTTVSLSDKIMFDASYEMFNKNIVVSPKFTVNTLY